MNINAVKLKRLVAHFNDEGENTPNTVAEVIGSQPENVSFCQEYVKAAAEELGQPELIEEFETAVATQGHGSEDSPSGEEEQASPPAVEEVTQGQASPPAVEEVTQDQASPPAEDGVNQDQPTSQAEEGSTSKVKDPNGWPVEDFKFIYTSPDGVATNLQVMKQKGNTVILENKVEAPKGVVKVAKINGADAELRLTELQSRPAGDLVTVNGKELTVAALLVIAEAS